MLLQTRLGGPEGEKPPPTVVYLYQQGVPLWYCSARYIHWRGQRRRDLAIYARSCERIAQHATEHVPAIPVLVQRREKETVCP